MNSFSIQSRAVVVAIFILACAAFLPTTTKAYPYIAEVTTTSFPAGSTSHNVRMPNSVQGGDLLIVFLTYNNPGSASANTPSGWTKQTDDIRTIDVRLVVYTKDATGDEGNALVNFTTTANAEGAAHVWRIPAAQWYGNIHTGIATTTATNGDTDPPIPDPPSLTPAWGTAENLWITYLGTTNGVTGVSAWPTGYTDNRTFTESISGDNVDMTTASKISKAASDNPSAFTLTYGGGNIPWAAQTMAIRPPIRQSLQKPANNLGLVGYWSFNEGTGTRAGDFSGRGNHGTVLTNGGSLATWGNGKLGKALNFDATDDYVQVSSPSGIPTGDFTYSAWIYFGGGYSYIMESGNGWTEWAVNENDQLELFIDSIPDNPVSTTVIPRNTWTHVAVRRSGSTITQWVNGVQDATTGDHAGALDLTGCQFLIGVDSDNDCPGVGALNGFFNGKIDEARVYNRALSNSEMLRLAKAGAVKFTSSSVALQQGSSLASGLVGHWTFDGQDMTNSAIADRSGNGNNSYIYNGATSSAKAIGKLGQGVYLPGATGVIAQHSASLNLSSTISVAFWIKGDAFGDFDAPMQKSDFASGWAIQNDGGASRANLYMRVDTATDNQTDCGGITNGLDGSWHHVVYVLESGGACFAYKDGALAGQGTYDPTGGFANTQPVNIGNNNGNILATYDDVRLYSKALTAGEVKQLYNLGKVKISN